MPGGVFGWAADYLGALMDTELEEVAQLLGGHRLH